MNFETLKKSHLKRNIITGVIVVAVISAMILNFTKAKYKITQSIPLVNGTINYTPYDFNTVAIYIEGDNGYEKTDTIPESGYEFNDEESYCTVNNERDDSISLSYDVDTKTLTLTPITTKGTKCYLYFDKKVIIFYDQLLADNPTRLTRTDFNTAFTSDNVGTLYITSGNLTEDGSTVYYFAGNALNNWVKFAGFYWRIIRTNEDKGIRLLYSGTSPDTVNGYISKSTFNSSTNNPIDVGYMYGSTGSLTNNRANTTNSKIKEIIDNWYSVNLNNKSDILDFQYESYLSLTAIYCNDRATDNKYVINDKTFSYAASQRFVYSQNYPTYKCGNNPSGEQFSDASIADKFSVSTSGGGNGQLTYPIALITTDEIVFAGGSNQKDAKPWWYNNSTGDSITGTISWWTMTPSTYNVYNESCFLYAPEGDGNHPGYISGDRVNDNNGIRPVLSLKSCVNWVSGNGSSSNPYEVSITSACASAEN